MDHHGIAQRYLDEANDHYKLAHTNPNTSASLATAHAVLALLDYIKQDDANEVVIGPEQAEYIQTLQESTNMYWDEVLRLRSKVKRLEEELEGTRTALRARDDELNTEMKAAAADD